MERIAWVNSGIEELKKSMDEKIEGDVKSIQRKMEIRI